MVDNDDGIRKSLQANSVVNSARKISRQASS